MAKVCAEPGCPEIAIDNRCALHQKVIEFPRQRDPEKAREYDKRRGNRHKRGYDSKWDKARDKYLSHHPFCSQDGCNEQSTDVDHIKPWRQGGKKDWGLFWDKNNWQALCHSHHSMKTARDGLRKKR